MSSRKYFGTDGIRGLVGQYPVTPEFVMKLGYAAGKVLAAQGTKKVLIGKDTRISGYMLESALEAGFSAAGIDIGLLGPMPTPAIAYLTKTFRAEAGIVISASHNPYYDNGIKFFSQDGQKLPDDVEMAIEAELDKPMGCVESGHLGKANRIEDAAGRYIEFCKSNFPSQLSLQDLTIVVDCAHGATYHIAPNVFRELGATVIEVGTSPNGTNINDGCGATSMAMIQAAVIEHKADLGIALDGDADRLMLVDDLGAVVDGDQILYILAKAAKLQGTLNGGVVGTLMSNLGLELALKQMDIPFKRAKVGDRYVVEQLKHTGWKLGGEGSGHILHLDYATTGDGIVASLLVLTALIQQKQSLRDYVSGMQKLPQVLLNVRLTQNNADEILNTDGVKQAVVEAETVLADTGRVLLRKSGTEPLIRVMVESTDPDVSQAQAEHIATAIKDLL